MREARFVHVTEEAAAAGFCCRVLMTERVWDVFLCQRAPLIPLFLFRAMPK